MFFGKDLPPLKIDKRLFKYRLSLPLTLLTAVLLSGAITLLALWCQPSALRSGRPH